MNKTRSVINRVYADIKNTHDTKINYIMIFFSDHCNAVSIERFAENPKLSNISGILQIFIVNPYKISLFSPHLQKVAFQV